MQNLLDDLKEALKGDERLVVEGNLNKAKIEDLALNMDATLLKTLLANDLLKEHFFQEVDGVLIFDKIKFQKFISNKSFLPDSYTAFKNKIGLTANEQYLAESKEVALAWPHKDCVLEGDQEKDDSTRNELFWNEILAPDDIDRLLSPKVFTCWKKFDREGCHEFAKPSTQDNYIIKGNSLLVLHSLSNVYRRQVKLIYIDPPYNTGSDSFLYNDKFNHSTWLTFIKNRLQIAEEFLSTDGVIFVHCDDNEQAYLKVLMDEIFDRSNFVETITVVNNPRGRDYGGIANMHEFIHVYAYDIYQMKMYRLIDKEKSFPYEDKKGGFEIRELRNRNTAFNDKNRPNLLYPFYLNPSEQDENGFFELNLDAKSGWIKVLPSKSQGVQTVWRWSREKSLENINTNIVGKAMHNGNYMIIEKYRGNSRLARSVWWDKDVNSERGTVHLRELFGKKVFDYPKPEGLMQRIIEIATRENDLILDYHLGSGTTASVAHKMKRKYIGIEQMDYVEDVTVERMKKVIAGEQGGKSTELNWHGGGSFIYCELQKANELWVDKIQSSKSSDELKEIWQQMQEKAFISYRINVKAFNENAKDFKELSLEEQKMFLIEALDKNLLYVNYSEIDDKDYEVSEEDKKLNHLFYSLKK